MSNNGILKKCGIIMQMLFASSVIAMLVLIILGIKYMSYKQYNEHKDSMAMDAMETYMSQKGFAVVHPDNCDVEGAVDGLIIYKTTQAQAEYLEFADTDTAMTCYDGVIDNIVAKYAGDPCLEISSGYSDTQIRIDNCYYYLKHTDKYVLYVWTTKGLEDEVLDLVRSIPI